MPGTDKIMQARLLINGAMIMLSDDMSAMMGEPSMTPTALGGTLVALALNLDDVQSFWDVAVAGGASVRMPLADMFWGVRYGEMVDRYGHRWSFSQTLSSITDAQMKAARMRQSPPREH